MAKGSSHEEIWQERGDKSDRITRSTTEYTIPILKKIRGETDPFTFRVIDIGCGSGHSCDRFAEEDFDVYGTDISEKAVSLTRQKLSKYEKLRHNMDERVIVHNMREAFPYESEYFDAGISFATLHHNTYRQLDETLMHIHRILKPDAKFITTVVNRDALKKTNIIDERFGKLYRGPHRYDPRGSVWAKRGDLFYIIHDTWTDMEKGIMTSENNNSPNQPNRFIPSFHIYFNKKIINDTFGKYFEISNIEPEPPKNILLVINANKK